MDCCSGAEGSLLVARPWKSVDSDQWEAHNKASTLVAALDPHGRAEGALRHQICKEFGLPSGVLMVLRRREKGGGVMRGEGGGSTCLY